MAQDRIQVSTTPPLPGTELVSQINDALAAASTWLAGNTDPAALTGVGPYTVWADTANNLLKMRNDANSAWLTIGKLSNMAKAENIDIDPISDIEATDVQGALEEISAQATETKRGTVALATSAQAQALTADDVAITPKKLAAAFGGANQGLSTAGYQKLPGGLILQWGDNVHLSGTAPFDVNVTFPVAFPTAVGAVIVQYRDRIGGIIPTSIRAAPLSNLTQFVVGMAEPSGGTNLWISWIAIGY